MTERQIDQAIDNLERLMVGHPGLARETDTAILGLGEEYRESVVWTPKEKRRRGSPEERGFKDFGYVFDSEDAVKAMGLTIDKPYTTSEASQKAKENGFSGVYVLGINGDVVDWWTV